MNIDKFKDSVNSSMSNNSKNDLINRTNDNLLRLFEELDYNPGNAIIIVKEELSELIQAVSKMERFGKEEDWWHLLEEFADVAIAMDIIRHKYHLEDSEIKNAKLVKLNRMIEKIKEKGGIV